MLQLQSVSAGPAINRPVPLRMRSDLEIFPRQSRGQLWYIIKDPVTSSHHRLWAEEFALLGMLDGQASISDMKRRFESIYPAARLDTNRLQALFALFYRNGLVLSDNPGQADALWNRGQRWKQQQRQSLSNFLAFRLPGFNPDRWLQALDRRAGWLFSPAALVSTGCCMLVSWLYLALHLHDAPFDTPSIQAYLTPSNLIWLLLVAGLMKFLHELGHGLACTHYGSQCHEMGVMFLACVPTLYCDVSDAWTIASRWQRAFIAAAGMWVEMLIATVCAWLWWTSQPGLVHALCFNAMIIGTLSTLLINGNPLLRYDGYFILADTLDLPNLWRQSRAKLIQQLDAMFFTKPTLTQSDDPQPVPSYLSFYAVMSVAYQTLIVGGLLLMIYTTLRNARWELLGVILVSILAMSAAAKPARSTGQLLMSAEHRRHLRWLPTTVLTVALMSVVIVFMWPLPYSFRAPVLFQMSNYTPVTIVEPGRLIHCLPEGSQVEKDQVIAQLASPEVELELLARTGELGRQNARLAALQSKRTDDPTLASQITAAQEAVRGLTAEIERLRAAQDRLSIRAPIAGVLLAPLQRTAPKSDWDVIEQTQWTGTPLDKGNQGCYLSTGDTLCAIAVTDAWQALAFVSQDQVELLEIENKASIRSSLASRARWNGQVTQISSQSLSKVPQEIQQSGMLPMNPAEDSNQLVQPIYVATVDVVANDTRSHGSPIVLPLHNSLGIARLHVASQSLAYRAWRTIDATFTLPLTKE